MSKAIIEYKAIVEYNLPKETSEFWDAVNGPKYRVACSEVERYCRDNLKHTNLSRRSTLLLDTIRQILRDELSNTDWDGV